VEPLPAGDAPPPVLTDARAGDPLAPVWEIRPTAGAQLAFDGVVDGEGNVYWRELSGGGPVLASATRDGALRFRAPGPKGGIVLAGAALIAAATEDGGCSGGGSPVVEAYSAATGARLWRRELLADVEAWMRGGGSCRYGAIAGVAAGERVLVAASILDHGTGEHESGYVALDPASGELRWAVRTSAPGNVMMAGAPVIAEDGDGYGSSTQDYRRDELLVFHGLAAPDVLATPADPWHGGVLAAYGTLLVSVATGGSSWEPPPSGVEIRCRRDGGVLASAGTVAGTPLLALGALWLFGDVLSRHDVATGALRWRVRLGAPPDLPPDPARRPLLLRSSPLVTAAGAVVFTEQQAVAGQLSSDQQLGTPVLRVVDVDGAEPFRRTLPLEAEGYAGASASHGGRLFLAGQVLPSAGANGVIRAFDVPGLAPPEHGWMTPNGSMSRDNRAR
jgi:outer membrane protein assembly factor BamB